MYTLVWFFKQCCYFCVGREGRNQHVGLFWVVLVSLILQELVTFPFFFFLVFCFPCLSPLLLLYKITCSGALLGAQQAGGAVSCATWFSLCCASTAWAALLHHLCVWGQSTARGGKTSLIFQAVLRSLTKRKFALNFFLWSNLHSQAGGAAPRRPV